jgi:ABC-type nitrate/sulfonate/bicarbonate transport system permease component
VNHGAGNGLRPTDALGVPLLTHRQRILLAAISVAVTFALWWLASTSGWVDKILLPSPREVLAALHASVADGSLLKNVVASLLRVLEGFVAAFVIAVPLGVAMGVSRIVYGLVDPLLELLRPIPPIAVIPLAILWFGIDELSKVFIIAYGAFFPILVNTLAGFREVERVQVRAAQALGAKRFHIFRDVVLRSAFPFIIVGARLGMSMAFIVLVAAELIASSAGLGFMISDARYNFRTDQMFLGMACIGVLGFTLNALLLRLERSLLKWKSL